MTQEQQAMIIRKHYGLNRQVTAEEVTAEIKVLTYKSKRDMLDDRSAYLAAKLRIE